MDSILNFLRDPIWTFIGVMSPLFFTVVVYAFKKLKAGRKQTQENGQVNEIPVREIKDWEKIILIVLWGVVTIVCNALITRVFDTYISDNVYFVGVLFICVGLILKMFEYLDYDVAVYAAYHFLISCSIAFMLFAALNIGDYSFNGKNFFDLQIHDVVAAREIFLATYVLTFFVFVVFYFAEKKTAQRKLLAQQQKKVASQATQKKTK